jgi:hypothetical protein
MLRRINWHAEQPFGGFVQAAVQVARQVDAGADRIPVHKVEYGSTT